MKTTKTAIRALMRLLAANPMLTMSVASLIVPVALMHYAMQLAILPGGMIIVIYTVALSLVFTSWLVCQFKPTC